MNIKKLVAGCVCSALVLATAGCNIVTVNEEREANQVVATIGDVKITKKEALARYSIIAEQYGLSDSDTEYADFIKSLKKSTIDNMVEYEVIYQIAQQKGLESKLSAETKASIEKDYQDTIDSISELYETEGAQSSASPTATEDVDTYVDEYLASYGFTREGYKKYLYATEYMTMLETTVKAEITDISDEDLKKVYDSELETQQAAFDAAEDASSDTSDSSVSYESYIDDGKVVVYVPEGIGYYKHILIKFSDDISDQIITIEDDTTLTSAEISEQVQALEDEGYAEIQSKAEAVLAKVNSGKDFDTLIADYGEDPGMQSDTYKDGYLVGLQSSFVSGFKEACLALEKVGDTTGLIKSEYGYHIIKKVSAPTPGVIPFDQVKAALKGQELATEQSDHWDETLEEWKSDLNVSVNYDILYQ